MFSAPKQARCMWETHLLLHSRRRHHLLLPLLLPWH
jgi:hypothetical protein